MILNSLNNWRYGVQILVFTLSYFILAKICLTFGISYGNVSPFWLPAGIAAAMVLVWKYPVLPGIWAGTLLAVLTTEVSFSTAVIFAFGNSIESLAFLYLYQKTGEPKILLDTPENTFRFLVISGCSCLSAALIGVFTLAVQGYIPVQMIPLNFFTWWLGDISGILIIAPFLVTWHHLSIKNLIKYQWIEYAVFYVILLVGSTLILSGSTRYLFLIFILYAVFRFSLLHVLVTIFIGDLIAVGLTIFHVKLFEINVPALNLLSIQLFMLVISITGLLLYAALQERKTALDKYLSLTLSLNDKIKEQTRELKVSEVRFHELFSHMHSGVVIYSTVRDGEDFVIVDINQAAQQIEKVKRSDIIGRSLIEVFPGVRDFGLFDIIKEVWSTGIPRHFPASFYSDQKRSGWRENYVFQIPSGEVITVYDDISKEKETGEKLRNAREWLKITQKAARAGSWDWDIPSGNIIWSEEFFDLFGLPLSTQPSFETWLSTLHPDDRKPALEKLGSDLKGNKDLWNDYRIILPDGKERWIGVAGTAVYDADGKAVRASGICLDITAKKEIETTLRKSEERLKYTIEAINDGYWDWDIPSGIAFFNPRWYTMLGYEPYELPESYDTFISLIHPEDKERIIQKIASHFSHEKKPYSEEIRLLTKTGDYLWILTRGKVVVWDDNKKPLRMVGTHTDISSRKDIEEALRENEERYRSLVDNVPDIILVHQDGIIRFVNPAAIEMMGYPMETIIDSLLMSYVAPEYYPVVSQSITKRLKGEKIEPYEIEILMQSGNRKIVEVRGCLIHFSGDIASLNVLTDITGRKKIEMELRQFNEKLEREVQSRTEELQISLKEKEVLLKEIHHRVKNNMQVVSSLLFMQARSATLQVVKDVLLESQNRIKSIALVHEKLYQSGDLNRIDYNDYIQRIGHHIFNSYKIDPQQISLIIYCEPIFLTIEKAVPCSLIINELISNSLKYAFPDNRRGLINIKLLHTDGKYFIYYQDSGVGIPDDINFEHTRTLGLQLIKGLVKQLNGELSLDRTGGTRFVISFPE